MSKAEAQIRAMPWAQLLALRSVAGRLTMDRINEEINRRIRAAHTNQPSRSWYSDPNSARQILTNPNVAATVQEAKAARSEGQRMLTNDDIAAAVKEACPGVGSSPQVRNIPDSTRLGTQDIAIDFAENKGGDRSGRRRIRKLVQMGLQDDG